MNTYKSTRTYGLCINTTVDADKTYILDECSNVNHILESLEQQGLDSFLFFTDSPKCLSAIAQIVKRGWTVKGTANYEDYGMNADASPAILRRLGVTLTDLEEDGPESIETVLVIGR